MGHAYVYPVRWNCPVEVFGRTVRPGDLIHADKHGFLVIAPEEQAGLLEAVRYLDSNECNTVIPAARDCVGRSVEEMLAGMEDAIARYGANVKARFPRQGEWYAARGQRRFLCEEHAMPFQVCTQPTAADERLLHRAGDGFLPERIYDIHAHLTHTRHFAAGTRPAFLAEDRAYGLRCFAEAMGQWMPGRTVEGLFFGYPCRGNDRGGENAWLRGELAAAAERSNSRALVLAAPGDGPAEVALGWKAARSSASSPTGCTRRLKIRTRRRSSRSRRSGCGRCATAATAC